MPLDTARRYTFQYSGILANAPRDSGIFALFMGDKLSYIDGADSIYSALLDQWDQKRTGATDTEMPTSFAFERCDPDRRHSRVAQLVFKCRPSDTAPHLRARER